MSDVQFTVCNPIEWHKGYLPVWDVNMEYKIIPTPTDGDSYNIHL